MNTKRYIEISLCFTCSLKMRRICVRDTIIRISKCLVWFCWLYQHNHFIHSAFATKQYARMHFHSRFLGCRSIYSACYGCYGCCECFLVYYELCFPISVISTGFGGQQFPNALQKISTYHNSWRNTPNLRPICLLESLQRALSLGSFLDVSKSSMRIVQGGFGLRRVISLLRKGGHI